jgi:hypothetical protein
MTEQPVKEPQEFCPTPREPQCCQQPVVLGNAGFIVWRCEHCGSESWT